MRIKSLQITNFRAIKDLSLTNLEGSIVLAGPNGCGKSCILNAVRLLKSSYGSYEQDEYQQWMQESQIDLNKDASELHGLFQDTNQPVHIAAEFELSEIEKAFLKENLRDLLEKSHWSAAVQQVNMYQPKRRVSLAANQRKSKVELEQRLGALFPLISSAIDKDQQVASLTIPPAGNVSVQDNQLLEFIFATYDPVHLGVIDYHSPHRVYGRTKLNSVNLTIDSNEQQQQRQTALYGSKHGNIKSEMTSTYVRHLISKDADPSARADDDLTATIRELFATFLPGKEFLGPVPTSSGLLNFPVRLSNGATHDLDELSSGEKEIVYGYLRLHSSAPHNSIIMIDEPELHLNPKLLGGLADFYQRHLGKRLNNQLWLVSHSDILIREAAINPAFKVFHIQPATALDSRTQATEVAGQDELERLLLELVGDLAAFRPGNKLVIFESDEETAFDRRMTTLLFPEFAQKVNFISAGPKKSVIQLQSLLNKANETGQIRGRFFAITDPDADESLVSDVNRYQWDVYHIENYLLSPPHIFGIVSSMTKGTHFANEGAVLDELKNIATELLSSLVAHRLRTIVNASLMKSVNLRFDPSRSDVAGALAEMADRSLQKMSESMVSELSLTSLQAKETEIQEKYRLALADGSWISKCKGRDVLKAFAGRNLPGMPYEYFRDLIIDRMVSQKFRPSGMQRVIDKILQA